MQKLKELLFKTSYYTVSYSDFIVCGLLPVFVMFIKFGEN